jgi:hypothetical protein
MESEMIKNGQCQMCGHSVSEGHNCWDGRHASDMIYLKPSQTMKKRTVDLSMDWRTAMKYLVAVIESHAKKSYFETVDGESAKAVVREYLMLVAQVADVHPEKWRRSRVE